MADKAILNKGLVAAIVGGGLILWAVRALGSGLLRTPTGVILNESNNGESFVAKVGSVITVTLESNPSVGTWRLSPANDPLFNQPSTSSEIKTQSGYAFKQSRTWRLTPAMLGTHRVQLDYQRGDAPTKTYSFVVTVVP